MKRFVIAVISMVSLSAAAKEPLPTPADMPVLGEVEPFLFEHILESKDPDCSLANISEQPAFQALVKKHKLDLFGGPMVGCLTPNGASIWVRTAKEADVEIVVRNDVREVSCGKGRTSKQNDLTTVVAIEGLDPFSHYEYTVAVDGIVQDLAGPAVFRTAPKKGQKVAFDIAFGGGARYVHEHEGIWDTVAKHKPLAFLHLGDNLYIDDPENRKRHNVYYYRRQLRPEFRRMVSGCGNYSIWDDHDFGVNDSSGGPAIDSPAWKRPVWNVFKDNWVNPGYGGGEKQPGCWYSFSLGDVEFFMTDGRYYRDFKKGKTMLGPVQKAWLLKALSESTATFKVIASGTLWTELADKGGKDSWWGVKEEREEIFSLIDQEKIGGVVLLSADRHRCDIYRIDRPNGYPLYEFESSKLTNNHTHPTKKSALFSYNEGNFFAKLRFDMTQADPTVTFSCITLENKTIHELEVKRSALEKQVE